MKDKQSKFIRCNCGQLTCVVAVKKRKYTYFFPARCRRCGVSFTGRISGWEEYRPLD